MIPLLAEYTQDEIRKRLAELHKNWKEELRELVKTVIREVLKDQLRDVVIAAVERWAIKTLFIKVGTKITPVVNLIFALKDLGDDEEAEKFRNLFACLIMATAVATSQSSSSRYGLHGLVTY
ncbi:MAG: hypothetical protein JAY90_21950 [Candidatus Thiodiazotropha lotti]|nr:hypothetical protein [Candidatus Thiodiazotropha lotti]